MPPYNKADADVNVHIKGTYDATAESAFKSAAMAATALTVTVELATRAFFKFADAQEGMVKLANSTNLAKERVKEIYTEMERLAGKTGFGVESLNTAFRNFVSRTGMDDANAEAVFKDLASAAVLADTSVEEMTQSAGAALRNMRIPGDQAKEMFSGIASGMGEMSKSFIADLPRLTLDMANLGLTGADNMKKLVTEYHVAAQTMGSTANAGSALHSILTGIADSSSKLGERAHQMVAANEAAGASADVLLDNLTKFYHKEGALEATWRGRQRADINGLTALQAEYFRRRYGGLGKMTEAEKEYAVKSGEARAKIAAMEATVTAELRALGYAIGESVIEVGTLIGELGKLMGVNTSIKSVSGEIRTIADTIKEVNNLVSGATVDWKKLTPSFDFSFNKPPVIATLQREHEIAKQQGENTSALNKLTDTLLKKLGFGGAGVKPMSFGGSAIGNDNAGGARLWNAGYGGTGTYGSGSTFMTPYSSGGGGGGFQRASYGGPGGGSGGGGYDRGSSGGYPGRGGVGGRGSTKGGDPGVSDTAPKMSQGPTGIWQDRPWPGPGSDAGSEGSGGGARTPTPSGGWQADNVPRRLSEHVGQMETSRGLGYSYQESGPSAGYYSYNSDAPNRRKNTTEAAAQQEMNEDLAEGLKNVDRLNPNLPDGIRFAAASLAFNAGQGVLTKLVNDDGSPTFAGLLKQGKLDEARQRFMMYNKENKGGQMVFNQGLANRRKQEGGPGGLWDKYPGRTASPAGSTAQPGAGVAMLDTPFGQQPIGGRYAVGAGGSGVVSDGQNRVVEAQRGATRNQALSDQLKESLEVAAERAGVKLRVTSGGQPSSGPNRKGSHRHDYGDAADHDVLDDSGNVLPRNDPRRIKYLEEMAAAGAGGAGVGYMSDPYKVHGGLTDDSRRRDQLRLYNRGSATAEEAKAIDRGNERFYAGGGVYPKRQTTSQVAGPGAGSGKEDTWGKDAKPIEHTGKLGRDTTYDDDTIAPTPRGKISHGPPAPEGARSSYDGVRGTPKPERDTTYDDDTPAPIKRAAPSKGADTGVNKQVSRPPKKEPNNPASRSADHTIHKRWGDSKRSGSVNH